MRHTSPARASTVILHPSRRLVCCSTTPTFCICLFVCLRCNGRLTPSSIISNHLAIYYNADFSEAVQTNFLSVNHGLLTCADCTSGRQARTVSSAHQASQPSAAPMTHRLPAEVRQACAYSCGLGELCGIDPNIDLSQPIHCSCVGSEFNIMLHPRLGVPLSRYPCDG